MFSSALAQFIGVLSDVLFRYSRQQHGIQIFLIKPFIGAGYIHRKVVTMCIKRNSLRTWKSSFTIDIRTMKVSQYFIALSLPGLEFV